MENDCYDFSQLKVMFFYWTNSLILILFTINDKDLRCWDAAMFCIFARKSIIEVVAINQLIFLLVGVTLSYNLVCLVAANSSKRQLNLLTEHSSVLYS